MALTAKQRKQNQLAREHEERRKLPDATYEFLKIPFHEEAENDSNWSSVTLSFELMGIDAPVFEDDRGPEDFAMEFCFATDEDRDETFAGYSGSIGRAELMVDFLLDAAIELAGVIRNYKKRAISAQRKEIEEADLSDPDDRRKAMETIARLARIEDVLDKNVRRTLPQWIAKGI